MKSNSRGKLWQGVLTLWAMFAPLVAEARTIRVPTDVATIQGAIDTAVNGDRVLVAPGTYFESIDFNGKAITVVSEKGPDVTIVDAGRQRSVVRFHSGETRATLLKGFTLRNGIASDAPLSGGGVQIFQASPTVDGNVVTSNSACNGHGVSIEFSSALVRGNHIIDNHTTGCGGGSVGGGVYIGGAGAAEVTDNLIEYNQTSGFGGGIGMNAAGKPVVSRNVVRRNSSNTWGGGISTINDNAPTVTNNLVHSNSAGLGGGLYVSVPQGSPGGIWANNTVADNVGLTTGSELYTTGFMRGVQFVNNIFRMSMGNTAIYCDASYSAVPPTFTTNDFIASIGLILQGSCGAFPGSGANVSVDPLFVKDRNRDNPTYKLSAGSPLIDAGSDVPASGTADAAGRPRVLDGNADGVPKIDLGSYEYQPR